MGDYDDGDDGFDMGRVEDDGNGNDNMDEEQMEDYLSHLPADHVCNTSTVLSSH